jgi:hypothetical protein
LPEEREQRLSEWSVDEYIQAISDDGAAESTRGAKDFDEGVDES